MFVLKQLGERRREIDAEEAAWLEAVHKYDVSGEWHDDGFGSCAAALRAECNLTHAAASATVKLARRLHDLPAVRDAFATGDLSRAHADTITRACTTVERTDAISQVQVTLADAARHVNADELRGTVRYVTDAIDGDDGALGDAHARDLRRLHVSQVGDQVAFNGSGDLESSAYVMTALDAEMERDFVQADSRTKSQRRWDALTNICRRALDQGEFGSSRAVRPHVTIVMDLQRLDTDPVVAAQARCDVSQVGRLSRATIRRILCDCSVSRVVLDGPSQVLDVGRSRRTVAPSQWKALVARDHGCVSCGRPPWMCEAHHIIHWTRSGPTNLANLELRCWTCHAHTHRHDAQPRDG